MGYGLGQGIVGIGEALASGSHEVCCGGRAVVEDEFSEEVTLGKVMASVRNAAELVDVFSLELLRRQTFHCREKVLQHSGAKARNHSPSPELIER